MNKTVEDDVTLKIEAAENDILHNENHEYFVQHFLF